MRMKKHGPRPIAVLPLGFLMMILIGALLLTLPAASRLGERTPFPDALFTATSASCVTGLIVRDTGTYFSLFGQIVIIVLIQLGGLGFMTMSAVLFSLTRRRVSLYERMSMAEGIGESKLSGVVALCRGAVFVTAICEGIGAALLALRFVPKYGPSAGLWRAVFTSISAFCNAGFDLNGNYASFTGYTADAYTQLVIMALIVAGGLGFAVIKNVRTARSFHRFTLQTKLVLLATAGLIVLGTAVILFLEYNNPKTLGPMPFWEKTLNAMFQSVTLRTAGFNTIDQLNLHDATKGVGIALMLVGGAPAGTAGGLKITTVLTLAISVMAYIRGRARTTVLGRTVPHEQIRKAMTVFFCGVLYLMTMTIVISAIEQYRTDAALGFWNQLYEATSAFCTVGISVGVTSVITTASRMILASMMFVGRVGLVTVAMSLTNYYRPEPLIGYPEESVQIG